MALARRLSSSLKRALYTTSFRLPAVQSRHIVSSRACFDEGNDAGGLGEGPEDEASSPSLPETEEGKNAVKPPPYAEELRKIMTAKYLSDQPIARPHSLCDDSSDVMSLEDLRLQYKKKVAAVRKQYILEMERKRAAKATQDKKQKEEIRLAKEERLRLKKEKSARRAIEVAEEKRILQEQLAEERAERRAYRKMMDVKIEEWRQREKDLVRQDSGTWIEEKDLEMRIVQAYMNPIEL